MREREIVASWCGIGISCYDDNIYGVLYYDSDKVISYR